MGVMVVTASPDTTLIWVLFLGWLVGFFTIKRYINVYEINMKINYEIGYNSV